MEGGVLEERRKEGRSDKGRDRIYGGINERWYRLNDVEASMSTETHNA